MATGTSTYTGAAQDGNWSTAGNWTGTNTPPTALDDVIVSGGDRDIVLGLSPAVQYASLTVTEGFKFNIGTSSAPLVIAGVTGKTKIVVAGSFIKLATITNPIVAATVVFRSRGLFALSTTNATAVTALYASGAGTVDIDGAAAVTHIKINGPTVTAGSGTAFTTAKIGAGQLTSSRSIGTFSGAQARLILQNAAAITTSATCGGGCTFNHQSSGTIAELEMFTGSSFTPQSNTNSSVTITLLYRHVGSNFEREWGGNTVTVTTEIPI